MAKHRKPSSGLGRRTTVTLSLFVALLALPSAAWAFWSATGLGAGSATTATLAAPADVTASATGTAVSISWTAPTQSFNASTLGFQVRDSANALVCGATTPITTTHCSYTATPGTYSYSVTAVYASWTAKSAQSNQLTVQATPDAVVVDGGSPQSTAVTTAFATRLSAKVTDSSGSAISGITVTFTAPGTGASGSFAGATPPNVATAQTNSSGVATAPVFTANGVAGSYTVGASVSGVTGTAGFALTNTAGAAAKLTVNPNTTPQSAVYGTAFATALGVTVRDANDNPVSGVEVTFTAPATGASGTFTGGVSTTKVTTGSSGVATAPTFTANSTLGTYSVSASAAGATPATFSLTNTAGAANAIAVSAGSGQAATVATAFPTALAATVTDSANHPVAGVTVTFTAPSTGASGTFANGTVTTSATTNASGVATASTFTAGTVAGAYTVTGSVSGVATTAAFSLTNNPGVASRLVWSKQPGNTKVSTSMTPPPTVQVADQFGNAVNSRNQTVTIALTSNTTGATLSGTLSGTTGNNGAVSFSGLSVNRTGTYTLTASNASFGSAVSTAFTIT